MRVSTSLTTILPFLGLAAAIPTSSHHILPHQSSSRPSGPSNCTTSLHFNSKTHNETVTSFFEMWNINSTLAYSILSPNFTLYQDRFPSPQNGSVDANILGQQAMEQFINDSRVGFSSYQFVNLLSFGVGENVVSRWQLNAVVGDDAGFGAPSGTNVSYNGTDIFILDRCTGLIDQVLSSQDLITLFHDIEVPVGQNGTV